jgi:hypothetical protein
MFNSKNSRVYTGSSSAVDSKTLTVGDAKKLFILKGLTQDISTASLTVSGNISQTGSATFSTGTGAISLNGNVTIAAAKTLSLSGLATFQAGSLLTTTSSSANGLTLTNTTAATNGSPQHSNPIILNGRHWNSASGNVAMQGIIQLGSQSQNSNPTISKISFQVGTDGAGATEKGYIDSNGTLTTIGGATFNSTSSTTNGLTLTNTTVATAGTQQPSNKILFNGQIWNSSFGSVRMQAGLQCLNLNSSVNPTVSKLSFLVGTDNNNATEQGYLDSNGNLSIGTTVGGAISVQADVSSDASASSQIIIKGKSDNAYQLLLGYNTTSNNGYIQSVWQSHSTTKLNLNPSGGDLTIGNASSAILWNSVNKLHFGKYNSFVSDTSHSLISFNSTSNAKNQTLVVTKDNVSSTYLSNASSTTSPSTGNTIIGTDLNPNIIFKTGMDGSNTDISSTGTIQFSITNTGVINTGSSSTTGSSGTVSQSGNIVTWVTGTNFSGINTALVGGIIVINGQTPQLITSYTDSTHITVSNSQTVSANTYTIYYGGTQFSKYGLGTIKNVVDDGSGNVTFAGHLNITAGSNKSVGQSSAMVAGSTTVNNTSVTASSIILLSHAGTNTANLGTLYIFSISAGTSFTIKSSNASDTDVVNWLIIN